MDTADYFALSDEIDGSAWHREAQRYDAVGEPLDDEDEDEPQWFCTRWNHRGWCALADPSVLGDDQTCPACDQEVTHG